MTTTPISAVLVDPYWRVGEYVSIDGRRGVAIELDREQVTLILTKASARRLAKSLGREASKP